MSLLEYIRELNEKSRNEMENAAAEGEQLWIGMLTEDLDYWSDMGVTDVESFKRRQDETTFSEMFKSAYGYRPRFDTSDWTPEYFQREFEILGKMIDQQEAEKAQEEIRAMLELEADIIDIMALGALNRKTAIRWMLQTETFYHEQDVESWVWDKGLLFTEYGRNLVKEILEIVEFKNDR